MRLQRHLANPILRPNPLNEWEALNVFNCGVVYYNKLFHMFYRAQGVDYVSRIGYAVSADGVHFNRLAQPVLSPQDEWETRGVEDPRITHLADEGRFIMAYTAYSPLGITPHKGRTVAAEISFNHPMLGGDQLLAMFRYRWIEHFGMPWLEHHVLKLILSGGAYISDPPDQAGFSVGGYSEQNVVDAIINGTSPGNPTLRGYPPGSFSGSHQRLLQILLQVPMERRSHQICLLLLPYQKERNYRFPI